MVRLAMSKGVVVCRPPGCLLGNATMAYLFARAHAERIGAELVMEPWIGDKIWRLPDTRRPTDQENAFPLRSEMDLAPDETNVVIRAYAQSQEAMIYTKRQAQEWLSFRYSTMEILNDPAAAVLSHRDEIVAHRRVGDFRGPGSLWPVISEKSYRDAAPMLQLSFVTQENPTPHGDLPAEISFLPDFYRLAAARFLLRGNSSFSWVAALLGSADIWSPRIDGLAPGIEHDGVRFERGNHCKLGNFGLCSDLHVEP